MMNDAKKLVQKIQNTNKEVVDLQKQIDMIGQEKLNQIIPFALNGLEFENIHKHAFSEDEDSYQDGDFCTDDNGQFLKGFKVLTTFEDAGEEDESEWQLHKEVFLLDNGTFMTFNTFYHSEDCLDCGAKHYEIERQETKKELACGYRNEQIITHILVALRDRANAVQLRKERMVERLDKLNSLMVS